MTDANTPVQGEIIDQAERLALLAALEESESRFQTLAEMAGAGVCIIQGSRFGYVNPIFEHMTEYSADELSKMNFWDLAPPDKAALSQSVTAQALNDSSAQGARGQVEIVTRSKSLRWLDVASRRIYVQGKPALLITMFDITEREARAREMQNEIEITNTLRATLRIAQTKAELIQIIAEQASILLNVSGVAIVARADIEDVLTIPYARGKFAHYAGQPLHDPTQITLQVMVSGSAYRWERPDALSEPPAMGFPDLSSLVCVPLNTQESSLGAIWLGDGTTITPGKLRLMTNLASIAANALQRVETLETLERRVQQRTAELEAANQRLKSLDRLKSRLVSDVSHELRTPVANLGIYAYLLEHDNAEHWPEHLAALNKQLARLKSIIENILDLSRLERNDAAQEFYAIDLNAIVAATIEGNLARAATRKIALAFSPAPDLPPIIGDRAQIGQVIENIISNAINYTVQGAVTVHTVYREMFDLVGVVIQDTGIGIDPQDVPHIFDRGYRGRLTEGVPGTGLGLGIVHEIVEAHRGQIEVESEVGKGTTFKIYFISAQDDTTPSDNRSDEQSM
jgi:PAS domain S-box-containing protein